MGRGGSGAGRQWRAKGFAYIMIVLCPMRWRVGTNVVRLVGLSCVYRCASMSYRSLSLSLSLFSSFWIFPLFPFSVCLCVCLSLLIGRTYVSMTCRATILPAAAPTQFLQGIAVAVPCHAVPYVFLFSSLVESHLSFLFLLSRKSKGKRTPRTRDWQMSSLVIEDMMIVHKVCEAVA